MRYTITIPDELHDAVKAAFPGASLSAAVRIALHEVLRYREVQYRVASRPVRDEHHAQESA